MKFKEKDLHESGRPLSKEEFINKIKTDEKFAKKWGDLGSIYGKQWRNWEYTDKEDFINLDNVEDSMLKGRGLFYKTDSIDQIQNLINDLKASPDSRRLMVSAWNVGEIGSMVLPPCHYGFQVYTRELTLEERTVIQINKNDYASIYSTEEMDKNGIPTRAISLMYNARSQDVPLGTSFNIASYALLLEILGKEVNMVPDELISNMGDCHIYLNQIDVIKEQLNRTPYELPNLTIVNKKINDISEYTPNDFILDNYKSHPAISIPLSN